MKQNKKTLAIFEGRKIRRVWDAKQEKWYFSVVDIVALLIDQPEHKKAQSYWTTLKNRLKGEGSQVVTKCDRLKMPAQEGGKVAKIARVELERKTGKKIVSSQNFKALPGRKFRE